MSNLTTIKEFKGKYNKLSNFYPAPIYFAHIKFPTVEHAFVASKSDDPMFWYKIQMIPADKAGKAKRLGRKIQLRDNWDNIKLTFMKKFLIQKFLLKEFGSFLKSTGNVKLIEGNHWHDNYWGDCHCYECQNIIGQNHLGILLMEVRSILYNCYKS